MTRIALLGRSGKKWLEEQSRIAKVVSRNYKIFQANLQRSNLATQELIQEAGKNKTIFALIQEPYTGNTGMLKTHPGTRVIQSQTNKNKPNKVAIVVFDKDLEIIATPSLLAQNTVAAVLKTKDWTIGVISVYFEDSMPIEPYLDKTKEALEKLNTSHIILGGDFNAWNVWWGSESTDDRGEVVFGWLEEMNLHILNEGDEPTFDTIRGGKRYKSSVDITSCTQNLLDKITDWEVKTDITSSDHNTIQLKLNLEKIQNNNIIRTTRVYNTKKAKWKEFKTEFRKQLDEKNINIQEISKINNIRELEDNINKYNL